MRPRRPDGITGAQITTALAQLKTRAYGHTARINIGVFQARRAGTSSAGPVRARQKDAIEFTGPQGRHRFGAGRSLCRPCGDC